ncbi:carbamoyltransferase HypF [Methanobrevibacter sp. TMH8]|uniref:carbamoyltransferase HypF n=1 Tax=Methanobrevibacter sp. TMH8 TaxID=2848611 RepID=UPI001CCD23E1|nr:carbamoyltransferase HypF [Methanobrevibacter sp. TMH8]MBZ9570162.1 carbamoyltransferase HypF [Methanobrevibacter sp. TMH8]
MKIGKILVQGIVQGVGFRPTVYRIANTLNLRGYVRNLGNVVEIILFENEKKVNEFITTLKEKKPPISKINSIELIWIDESEYESDYKSEYPPLKKNTFKILESSDKFSGASVIPPDLAICDSCLEEINDPNNRRYNYPFTACTDCGPRFTVIEDVPYDRDKTTMDDFPLCEDCNEEYTDPLDRRYHGEAICCEICGPSLKLYNHEEKEVKCQDPLKEAVTLLDKGKILAIKGIGGTHLVAKVTDDEPIKTLRKRLNRLNQPFAVMSPDLDTVKTFAEVSLKESKSLLSKERPIVVLKKNEEYDFAESLAPKLHNIGVMLPYSPLHYLLFNYTDEIAYIMTSANIPGEPMMIKNKDILSSLYGIADYYLLHNRKIINRCDDSVIRYRNNELSFIRRSRGYAPEPYDLKNLIQSNKINKDLNVLALGPELDVTFTLQKQGLAYVSQHIGNTNKYKTYEFLQEAIQNMMKITRTNNFDLIACDMHPQFFTSRLANEMGEKFDCDVIPVQHHHAHGAVLAIDNSLDELIFIAADGVGYGEDGSAWGGEIIYTDITNYKRLASLKPQKMPGGDISTKYPARMLASILYNSKRYNENNDELERLLNENYSHYFQHGDMEIKSVLKQIKTNLNVGISTSAGRILDSIAVALNICGERTYEGECSMKLESFAYGAKGNISIKPVFKKVDKRPVLDTNTLLSDIIELIAKGENKNEIAAAAQIAVSEGLAKLAIDGANDMGIDVIGATGGVFYNEAITLATKNYIEKEGFEFIQHKNSCAGDGSISLGQATIASSKMK